MTSVDLHKAMTQLPSAKTPNTVTRAHITELFKILDRVLDLNDLSRVRGLRFSQHCLRQRVMYDICERITATTEEDDDRPVVVAFGAGMFSSCSRGHAPGPVKGVRKALRKRGVEMYDVNKDYTSQLCNCCHSKVVSMYSQGGGMAIHGVQRCLAATCMRKTCNCNANVALNNLYVFRT
jgi:hypothetical protein